VHTNTTDWHVSVSYGGRKANDTSLVVEATSNSDNFCFANYQVRICFHINILV